MMTCSRLIIGHRGSGSGTGEKGFYENTPESFAQAFALGCDEVECDLALTADEQIVFFHDPAVNTGDKLYIQQTPLDRLHRVCPWIPTWEEVMQRFPGEHFTLEIKSHTPWKRLIDRLLQKKEFSNPDRFRIISFRPDILLHIKSISPRIQCGLIATAIEPFSPWVTRRQIRWCVENQIEEISGHFRLFSSKKIFLAHTAGLKTGLGPVDSSAALNKALNCGVHYLYTNRVHWLKNQMK